MRNQLIKELSDLARRDERVVLLTADLGFGVTESFKDEFPERFFNVGVAEQAMIAAATGLARAGLIPYCYSIATFSALRAFEFIRNGPVLHQLAVRIIGVGPGFDYENDGLTHFAVDDIAVLRSQPGLQIWAPSDEVEFSSNFLRVHEYAGPVYLRIPRRPVAKNYDASSRLDDQMPKVLVVAFGDSANEALPVLECLKSAGISSDFFEQHWLGSLDESNLLKLIAEYEICVSVETHYLAGGFGSYLLEISQELSKPPKIIRHGIQSLPIGPLGSRKWLSNIHMTNPAEIVQRVINALQFQN